MANPKRKPRGWKESTVRLSNATVTVFSGPGDDVLYVLHGTRLQRSVRRAKKGGR